MKYNLWIWPVYIALIIFCILRAKRVRINVKALFAYMLLKGIIFTWNTIKNIRLWIYCIIIKSATKFYSVKYRKYKRHDNYVTLFNCVSSMPVSEIIKNIAIIDEKIKQIQREREN